MGDRRQVMGYCPGVDMGTTYTAAAVWRDGVFEVASLGNRAPAVPSMVMVRDDGGVLVGESAARRAVNEPERVAREFKRRIGDPTPIIVGGSPYSADALTARLLRWVVDRVGETEGGPPSAVAVAQHANWGEYKKDLLRQAVARADLDDVVLRKTGDGWEILGEPQGIERLGGIDFDEAVLRHVVASPVAARKAKKK